jgi:glycosyltransferase involved in cell wall biosynthesis
MHILFLTHYFPPEVNAPASRTYENTKRWVRAGHKVTVITCAPNHPNGIIYPGYRNKWRQWDEKDGVRVLRVKTWLSANKGVANRSLNYFSYLLSAVAFCRLVKNVDLVVSTSPQFFCGLSGYFVSRRHACPWVVEVRDLWPESIHAVGAVSGRGVIGLLERIELFLYRKPDHIVALTPAFKRHMVKKGIAPEKIDIVTNGADLEQYNPLPKMNGFRARHKLNGKFIASYVGTHGMAHALGTVLQAAKLLDDQPKIQFLLVGDGAERENLLKQKEEMGLKNVLMLPQQSKDLVPEILAASDACMVLLRRTELFKTVIPSKIFEAMAMERPIILGVDGESRKIVEESGSGVFIAPESDAQLADAVLRMSRDSASTDEMGKTGGEFVRKHFSRDTLATDYIDVLGRVKNRFTTRCARGTELAEQ